MRDCHDGNVSQRSWASNRSRVIYAFLFMSMQTVTSTITPSPLINFPLTSNGLYQNKVPSISGALDLSNLYSTTFADDGFGSVLQAYPASGSTSASNTVSYFTLTLINTVPFDPSVLRFQVGKGDNSNPRGYYIRSSLDGYTSNIRSSGRARTT